MSNKTVDGNRVEFVCDGCQKHISGPPYIHPWVDNCGNSGTLGDAELCRSCFLSWLRREPFLNPPEDFWATTA